MSILILAEHNNLEVKSSTLNTISAASKVGSEIDILVIGSDIENIAKEIKSIRSQTVFNLRNSANVGANYIKQLLEELKNQT